MQPPGKRTMAITRQGPKRLHVAVESEVGNNLLRITLEHDFQDGPVELLDLFEEQFVEARSSLIAGQENVTAIQAITFISDAMTLYVKTQRDNLANVIVEEH
jgi:hypothetical protein